MLQLIPMRKLSEYESVLRQAMHLIAKKASFQCQPGLREIFAENRRLIVAINHGTPLGWLPSAALLALEALAAGAHERVPMGVMDGFFFDVPVLREFARWLTQTESRLSYEEVSARFLERENVDLVLFPEGSNCFFGPPEEIQEFRSPKFVELSVLSGAPILICVHRGSEGWSLTLPVKDEWTRKLEFLPAGLSAFLSERLLRSGLFTLPLWPSPMSHFEMRCELYSPRLSARELSRETATRRRQIHEESEMIRTRMRQLRDQFFLTS